MRKIFILLAMALPLLAGAQTTAHQGIRVSENQGTIDWPKVKAENRLDFIYVVAAKGATVVDARCGANIDQARKAGFKVGAFFSYDRHFSAQGQFDNFMAAVKGHSTDLLPVVSIIPDEPYNINIKRVDMLLQLLEKEYRKKPIVYTTMEAYLKLFCLERYASYHVYIANYGLQFPTTRYTLWEYTDREQVSGILEYVPAMKLHPTYFEGVLKR